MGVLSRLRLFCSLCVQGRLGPAPRTRRRGQQVSASPGDVSLLDPQSATFVATMFVNLLCLHLGAKPSTPGGRAVHSSVVPRVVRTACSTWVA